LAILLGAFASIVRLQVVNITAIILLFVGFEAHRVRLIPITTNNQTNAVVARLGERVDPGQVPIRLRFQAPWKEVGPRPDESTRPVIEVTDGAAHWTTPIMSGAVLCHKSSAPPGEFSVTLRWTSIDPAAVDPAAPGTDFQALACHSFLARLW